MGNDCVYAKRGEQICTFIGCGQASYLFAGQYAGGVRVKSEHNGQLVIGMCAADEFVDDLAMSAMNTIEDADGEL